MSTATYQDRYDAPSTPIAGRVSREADHEEIALHASVATARKGIVAPPVWQCIRDAATRDTAGVLPMASLPRLLAALREAEARLLLEVTPACYVAPETEANAGRLYSFTELHELTKGGVCRRTIEKMYKARTLRVREIQVGAGKRKLLRVAHEDAVAAGILA